MAATVEGVEVAGEVVVVEAVAEVVRNGHYYELSGPLNVSIRVSLTDEVKAFLCLYPE